MIARRLRRFGALLAVALAGCAGTLGATSLTVSARADGDPGSDVLVDQNYFVDWDSGLSDAQQVELGDLLGDAAQGGLPDPGRLHRASGRPRVDRAGAG